MNKEEHDFLKEKFYKFQGSDADYLLTCQNNTGKYFYSIIPNRVIIPEDANWTILETIDESIEWHVNHNYMNIKIYDLYAPFETALIKAY